MREMHLSSNGRFRVTYLDRRKCSNQPCSMPFATCSGIKQWLRAEDPQETNNSAHTFRRLTNVPTGQSGSRKLFRRANGL